MFLGERQCKVGAVICTGLYFSTESGYLVMCWKCLWEWWVFHWDWEGKNETRNTASLKHTFLVYNIINNGFGKKSSKRQVRSWDHDSWPPLTPSVAFYSQIRHRYPFLVISFCVSLHVMAHTLPSVLALSNLKGSFKPGMYDASVTYTPNTKHVFFSFF